MEHLLSEKQQRLPTEPLYSSWSGPPRDPSQKPRSIFATILDAVEIPPAPLSPPRRAVS
jgi:hypothetical protein